MAALSTSGEKSNPACGALGGGSFDEAKTATRNKQQGSCEPCSSSDKKHGGTYQHNSIAVYVSLLVIILA